MRWFRSLSVLLVAASMMSAGCGPKKDAESPKGETAKAAPKTKKAPPSEKKNPVPTDWEPIVHEAKQFGFMLPAGSTSEESNDGGIEMFRADLPDPYTVEVWVVTYRDKTLTKDDLWVDAEAVIKNNLKGTGVQMGPVVDLDGAFAVRDVSWTENNPIKGTVLIGTDINDNYIMVASCLEKDYAKNQETIDVIWQNFYLF
jgi:hypothetical protein